MCERLLELREAVERFSTRFDASLISPLLAETVVADAAAIEKMAATVKGLAAARAADAGVWEGEGDPTPAHRLARRTGTTVGAARDALETARRLEKQPQVAAAARRGELSPQQAAAISDAVAADPSAEHDLVEQAKHASLAEIRDEAARRKAAALPDPEARRKKIHDERRLRSYPDAGGGWNLHAHDNPEVGAEIMAPIEAETDRLFAAARAEGRREPREAYAMDALRNIVCGTTGTVSSAPARAKIIFRVDLEALLRGFPTTGEVCEIVGFGPVAVSALREMIECESSLLAAVATRGQQLLGAVHLGRRPTVLQQTALEWLLPSCAVKGCCRTARLQFDHRVDWAKSHTTRFELLDRLCGFHHSLKTREGWAVVEGTGKRDFVPPSDPRHPDRRHGPREAA